MGCRVQSLKARAQGFECKGDKHQGLVHVSAPYKKLKPSYRSMFFAGKLPQLTMKVDIAGKVAESCSKEAGLGARLVGHGGELRLPQAFRGSGGFRGLGV